MTELGDPAAADRHRRLLGVKLGALVAEHTGVAVEAEPTSFGAGAALVVDGAAWVLVDGAAARRLGASLAWAVRNGAGSLHVIAERDGGVVARRAAHFDFPISVWFPEGRMLLPVVGAAFPDVDPPDEAHLALIDVIAAAGAEPRVERGVVTGEVRGLEVCRVVDEPTVGNFAELNDMPAELRPSPADGVILEVGVGANDREAFQLLHGHLPTVDALAGVVDAVQRHRSADAPQHPLNRMAVERYLRWELLQDPGRLGMVSLDVTDPPVDRPSMKHPEPCLAAGVDRDGADCLIAFSAGVDLDAPAFLADAIAARTSSDVAVDRVVLATRARDRVAITADVADLLEVDVELVAL